MATKKVKFSALAARVPPDVRVKFVNKASRFGGTAYVMRELVAGFVEDRVTIKPPKIGDLYHVE